MPRFVWNLEEKPSDTWVLFFSVHFTASICYYETLQNNRESNKKLRGFPNCSRRGKVTASATKRSPCASRVHVCAHAGPSNPACCLQPAQRKLLRPKEELLKQLLTSVSSADRHLVPAPGLPSYRTIARPYLAARSECGSVCPVSATRHFRGKTPLWAAMKVLCNNTPAKFVPVIFNN